MLNNKDNCDKDTSFALQELGYNPYMFYDDGTPAIHLWDAQKWLREKKGLEANAFYDNPDAVWRFYILEIDSPDLSGTYAYNDAYMSYEEALLKGIKEAVKILKDED